MTKLEEEIQMAIKEAIQNPKHGFEKHRGVVFTLTTVATLAAADVAKKYIERAFHWGAFSEMPGDTMSEEQQDKLVRNKLKWLKQNGITE